MKVTIEKELCDPKDGEVVGPYYHLVVDGKTVKTFEEIGEAARYAERKLDVNKLEVAYRENPNCFLNFVPSE